MNEKLKILNKSIINGYQGPDLLYKYRSFDQYSFDMLENNYVFLCVAKKLDDKTECDTSIGLKQYISLKDQSFDINILFILIKMLKPYVSSKIYKNFLFFINEFNGKNNASNFMTIDNFLSNFNKKIANKDLKKIKSLFDKIKEFFNESSNVEKFANLIEKCCKAKETIGICSFCDSYQVEKMWHNNYGDDDKGYCIEYNILDYEYKDYIFPVIYSDDRNTDIIYQIISSVMSNIIASISDDNIECDKSQVLRLFLTKNTEWEYQNEWRLIGEPDKKIIAPNINKIYLGKNVSEENKEKISIFCKEKGIILVQI